jgi:hypothetical protein
LNLNVGNNSYKSIIEITDEHIKNEVSKEVQYKGKSSLLEVEDKIIRIL